MEAGVSHRAVSLQTLLNAKLQIDTGDHGNNKGVTGSETPTYICRDRAMKHLFKYLRPGYVKQYTSQRVFIVFIGYVTDSVHIFCI